MSYTIRRATHEDKPEWLRMRQGLWTDAPLDYLSLDLDTLLTSPNAAVFVASHTDGKLVAFIEVRLREYAEGCESSPVGYIEAWYVDEHSRGQKVGRELAYAAEGWAREKGMIEMASDTWLDNEAGMAECMAGVASVLVEQGQFEWAGNLFGASEALREKTGAVLWPANRQEYEHSLALLRNSLGKEKLSAAWAQGRNWPIEQSIQEAYRIERTG